MGANPPRKACALEVRANMSCILLDRIAVPEDRNFWVRDDHLHRMSHPARLALRAGQQCRSKKSTGHRLFHSEP